MKQEIIELSLKKFKDKIKLSNPSFTEYSLDRTIELCIAEALNLDFASILNSDVKKEDIKTIKEKIPSEWKLNDRIRKDKSFK